MEVIRVTYKPLTLLNWTRNVVKKVPDRWEEASAADLMAISRYQCQYTSNSRFISEFIGIPPRITRFVSEFELWSIAQHVKLLETYDALDTMMIPKIKAGKLLLTAPRHRLKGVTFGDFIFFDNYYTDFAYGDRNALDKMIAYLYSCDRDMTTDEICSQLAIADHATKYAIYINYRMVREWIALRYTYVFVKDKPKKKTGAKRQNWLPVLDSIIADDLANSEKYEQLPMHTVLRMLNNKIKEGYKRGKL